MGAQNGFEKLPKRSQKRTIRQRWALKMVSTSYPNDHPDAPFLSDGCSKWIRKLTQTIATMNPSPAMGAQNGFDKLPKRCQRCPIPQRRALKMVSNYRRNEPFPSNGRSSPHPPPRPASARLPPSSSFLPLLFFQYWGGSFIAVTYVENTQDAQCADPLPTGEAPHLPAARAYTYPLPVTFAQHGCVRMYSGTPRTCYHARWAKPTSRARARGKNQVAKSRARPTGAVTACLAELQLRVTPGAALDRAAT